MKTPQVVVVLLALACFGCGSSWKADGAVWTHSSGITVPTPSKFKAEASSATLTFRPEDDQFVRVYCKVVACSSQAEAEKLGLDRIETLKGDVSAFNKRSETPVQDAQKAFKERKGFSVLLTASKSAMELGGASHSVSLGYAGQSSKWVYYETGTSMSSRLISDEEFRDSIKL